jgi:hypothetical protein
VDRDTLALLSGALTMVCALPYLVGAARGSVRPQRMSWFVFALLSAVAAATQMSAGGGPGAWLSLGSAIGFGSVFLISIPRGEGGASAGDIVALLTGAAAVAIWLATDRPLLALATVIVAEVAAVGLSVRKAGIDPDSEAASSWAIDAVAGVVAIAAVTQISTDQLLYPVHHTVVNLWMVIAVVRGRRRRYRLAA